MNRFESKKIASGGLTTAITILSIYGGTLIRNNRISFMVLATYVSAIPYIMGANTVGVLSYAASSILALILVPNKAYAVVYIFAGIYPLVKLVCERHNIVMEFVFKYLWFNAVAAVIYLLFKNMIIISAKLSTPIGISTIIVGAQVLFLAYDFIFTKFIMIFKRRILYVSHK